MFFGGSSLPRSVTNGCSAVLLVVNLVFGEYISFVDWLLMSMYFDKPHLKGINASRGQAALKRSEICKDRNTAEVKFIKRQTDPYRKARKK